MLRLIPESERIKLGLGKHPNAFRTQEEIDAGNEVKLERTLEGQVMAFCYRYSLRYIQARTDRKSTLRRGWPDFTVLRPMQLLASDKVVNVTLAALLELKAKTGRLSIDQKKVAKELAEVGITVHVCFTYQAALDAMRAELLLE